MKEAEMISQGVMVTLYGMGGVFIFLLLLISCMYFQAWVFKYLGISDETQESSAEDDALIAAAIAVKIKNS